MHLVRWTVLLGILASTGVATVTLRSAMASCAWRIQSQLVQQQQLTQELASARTELARLTAPAMIRQRISQMQLCLTPPTPGAGSPVPTVANQTHVESPPPED